MMSRQSNSISSRHGALLCPQLNLMIYSGMLGPNDNSGKGKQAYVLLVVAKASLIRMTLD
jgi:hypothetical protein